MTEEAYDIMIIERDKIIKELNDKICCLEEKLYMAEHKLGRDGIRIKPFFKWFDIWVGVYIDRDNKAVYVIPFPMIGIKISYGN